MKSQTLPDNLDVAKLKKVARTLVNNVGDPEGKAFVVEVPP